jgi:hypothetical protein
MSYKEAEVIVSRIENFTKQSVENKGLFLGYVAESLARNKPVTFYNWECPPRRISYTPNGIAYLDYDLELEKVFRGEKFDRYTEIPRAVESSKSEAAILNFFKGLNFPFRFVKFIADTNFYYLTPQSLAIIGEDKAVAKFREFKKQIESATANYPTEVEVRLFTKTLGKFSNVYRRVFVVSYKLLKTDPEKILSEDTIIKQIGRTKKHVGIADEKWALDFSLRTIATYAAEGMTFSELSKTKKLSNCVWLNNHEIDDRTVKITNCYRRKKNLGDLPMVFLAS